MARWIDRCFGLACLACVSLTALPALAAVAPQKAGARPSTPEIDPIDRASHWIEAFRARAGTLETEAETDLTGVLSDLRRLYFADRERRHDIALVALDLAGIVPDVFQKDFEAGHYVPGAPVLRVRESARTLLDLVFNDEGSGQLCVWIANSVLAMPRLSSLERRCAAVDVLDGRYQPGTLLALFTCASAPEKPLREASLRALSGWNDENVHRFMVGQVMHALSDPHWASMDPLARHFERASPPLDSPALRELAVSLSGAAVAPGWRSAQRAIEILGHLPGELAVPPLIEALSVWVTRGQRGAPSKRMQGAILGELRRLSGRSIGPYPDRWLLWWKAMRSGATPGPRDDTSQVTKAGFFGLRPMTDRVLFVIDRSGSMKAPFGTGGHSRHEEAVRQMLSFLTELGPDTKFGVILFSDEPTRWHGHLESATKGNLAVAAAWVRANPPNGGTNLRPAIGMGMELRPGNTVDLDKLEADTVIVLCDGATAEGPGWVGPLLAAVNDSACVRFDCVQIGSGGDGTLEQLAHLTGGESVKVDH